MRNVLERLFVALWLRQPGWKPGLQIPTSPPKTFVVCLVSLLIGLIGGTGFAEIDMDDVVAMWLFDEGQGDIAIDSSPNGNDASFNGAPKWVTGRFGKAISFDGADDHLSAEDSDSLDIAGEEMTIVAWVDSDVWAASWNHVVRKTPENPRIYILGVHDTALPFTFLKTDVQQYADIQGPNPMPTGEWLHLAMTYNGAEVKIYANGEEQIASPAAGTIEASEGELRIGRGDPAGYFTCIIDEVAIFRVALSEDEIKGIMNGGLVGVMSVEAQGKLIEMWGNIKSDF